MTILSQTNKQTFTPASHKRRWSVKKKKKKHTETPTQTDHHVLMCDVIHIAVLFQERLAVPFQELLE